MRHIRTVWCVCCIACGVRLRGRAARARYARGTRAVDGAGGELASRDGKLQIRATVPRQRYDEDRRSRAIRRIRIRSSKNEVRERTVRVRVDVVLARACRYTEPGAGREQRSMPDGRTNKEHAMAVHAVAHVYVHDMRRHTPLSVLIFVGGWHHRPPRCRLRAANRPLRPPPAHALSSPHPLQ